MHLAITLTRCVAAGLLLAAGLACHAATLDVTPISHELPPGKNALSMTVVNRGDAPVTVQMRGFDWSQDERQERLAPNDAVLISPAIVTLAPGKSQIVRALFPDGEAGALRERSHRLLIDEIPSPGEGAAPVRLALRLSVPVFRSAKAQRPAALDWQLEAGSGRLWARNEGGMRERVRDLELRLADGTRATLLAPATPYVLPGASRSWALADAVRPLVKPGQPLVLSAQTDAGRVEVPLVAAP